MTARNSVLSWLLLLAGALPAAAQVTATAPAAAAAPDTVAPGVVYRKLMRSEGPWRIHVVSVDLRGGRYRLVERHAADALRGRERTSDMARRLEVTGHDVVAGINGDFFDLKTGENENDQVLGGRVLKAAPVTDSPWDTFRNAHSQFAVGDDGRVRFERFSFSGTAERAGAGGRAVSVRLDGVNEVPRQPDALVLFTADRDSAPRGDTIAGAVEVRLERLAGAAADGELRADGSGTSYVVTGPATPIGHDPVSVGTARLAAFGAARPRLDSLLAGAGAVTIRLGFRPDRGPLDLVVGGWPRLLVDGRSVAAAADSLEGTFPSFSARRHARSAVGVTPDSATLLLVTVDGPPEGTTGGSSVGMTLVELADLLRSLGAYQALALDGGGSSTLLAGERVVNVPSDRSGERKVGNAIFVVRK